MRQAIGPICTLSRDLKSRVKAWADMVLEETRHFKSTTPFGPYPKDPAVLKIVRVVVNVQSHCDLLSRCCVDTIFLAITDIFLSKKGSRRSEYGARRKKTSRRRNLLYVFIVVMFLVRLGLLAKNPRAHKNKIGPSPPPPKPPPPKRGILWTWVFLQKQRIFSRCP